MTEYFSFSDDADIKDMMQKYANALLNKLYLCSLTTKYRIMEIEIYYYSETHPDPFVHKSKQQQIPNQWYFHTLHDKGYREGTYKGIDITIGTPNQSTYGGILIRTIQDTETKEITEGSCSIANKIINGCGLTTMTEFAKRMPSTHIKIASHMGHYPLYLLKMKDIAPLSIISCPRVGLNLKGKNKLDYIMRRYRFTTYKYLKKFKCGIILSLYHDTNNSLQDTANETMTSIKNVEKYVEWYDNASVNDIDFNKNLKVSDLCNIIGHAWKNIENKNTNV